DELYYGAGWVVNADQTFSQHAGGNPTFATNIFLFPEEQLGISLLSNSASTNIDMLYNIKDILDGNISQSYQMSLMQISDIALSSATIALTLLAILFFFLGVRRKKQNRKLPLTKKRLTLIAFWLVTTIFIGILCLILPTIFGASWRSFLVWQTYSYLTALIALSLLSASITWFVYCYRYKCS
ncbi:serine hydrolase, partial [Bacillus haynesii]|nr:serine hydrolase [Bacillus haynesii]